MPAERLALLAAAQDGEAAHDCLMRFWLRALAPIPPGDVEGWIYWNVPKPSGDPSVDEVVAYAELVAMVSDPELNRVVRRQYWRGPADRIREPRSLYGQIGDVMADVVPLVTDGVRPRGGGELDRFRRRACRCARGTRYATLPRTTTERRDRQR